MRYKEILLRGGIILDAWLKARKNLSGNQVDEKLARVSKVRLEQCMSCQYLEDATTLVKIAATLSGTPSKSCSLCGCGIPAKTFVPQESCPIYKWGRAYGLAFTKDTFRTTGTPSMLHITEILTDHELKTIAAYQRKYTAFLKKINSPLFHTGSYSEINRRIMLSREFINDCQRSYHSHIKTEARVQDIIAFRKKHSLKRNYFHTLETLSEKISVLTSQQELCPYHWQGLPLDVPNSLSSILNNPTAASSLIIVNTAASDITLSVQHEKLVLKPKDAVILKVPTARDLQLGIDLVPGKREAGPNSLLPDSIICALDPKVS